MRKLSACIAMLASAIAGGTLNHSMAADPTQDPRQNFGPYNASFLAGGIGLSRQLAANSPLLARNAGWSMSGWVRPALEQDGSVVLAAVGDVAAGDTLDCRCLALQNSKLSLGLGNRTVLLSDGGLVAEQWHAVAATYDGSIARLYLDGREIAERETAAASVSPVLHLAPTLDVATVGHFGGDLVDFRLHDAALAGDEIANMHASRPNFTGAVLHHVGVGWPWQQRAWRGLQQPQDAWTLPQGKAPASPPQAKPVRAVSTALRASGQSAWIFDSWRMQAAAAVASDGAQISQAAYQDQDWHVATVPGTVLTTLIDRGIYPDPDYGLNNLAIPEDLSRQDYWYRTTFTAPNELRNRDLTLTFKGINYAAQIWLNGARLGGIRGAFIRGNFAVTQHIRPGAENALAVRISPPPHPGTAHEQSIAAGPGENGGNLAIDGPTFVAAEGWDWIAAIRDRNTGIWQDVELKATGQLRLLDPQVITQLPLPDADTADVHIVLPVANSTDADIRAQVEARLGGIHVTKSVLLPAGESTVELHPSEFPQLRIRSPKLWWPNGYGSPHLYTLNIELHQGAALSDSTTVRFGVRHVTYELSLFDRKGRLRRVEVDPTKATQRGERVVDVSHAAIKRTPNGWAASLSAAGETSAAVRDISSKSLSPYLAIRVNGVPIAVRGGNWGTDDSRKRIARSRLEPYFQLQRAANLNTIRNWVGQNTEDVFYELADEYGMLVFNDFWASTQDFQVEPQDPSLFLANAADVIKRYRNHPSIALWFGRNEGVPQPILNEGLDELIAALDGTRYYTGSSNSVNLQGSGPYNYRPASQYFTDLAQGFSVEVGAPSLATLESLQAWIPAADRWPLSDALAYHDWHFGGNGDVASFMEALATRFGAGASLEDFARKAQMLNYETYRAMFEGFNAGLWTRNSGRLLWMSHPAWPSNAWQIYSSDYDTHAAYYGAKLACESLHVQMNLPDFRLAVINTTQAAQANLALRSRIISLDNRVLLDRTQRVSSNANAVTTLASLPLQQHLNAEEVVFVILTLADARGTELSRNFYWQGRSDASYRRLNDLPNQPVSMSMATIKEKDAAIVNITLTNNGTAPALAAKLTMLGEGGERVLPVYYSDNYVSLLPGEKRTIEVRCPAEGERCARVAVRGWNVVQSSDEVMQGLRHKAPEKGRLAGHIFAEKTGA